MKKIINTVCAMSVVIGAAMPTMSFSHEVGLQLYSLRNQMEQDMSKAFNTVNSWGIKSVEGGGMLFGMPVDEYKALLSKNNMSIVSVDTNYEELRDNPMAVVYKARFYGSNFATFYWIPHGQDGQGFGIEDAKKAVDVMNQAGKVLKDNNITLQYHAHGYEFSKYEDGTIFDFMVKNTTEAQFQMDVFWINQAGESPSKLLKKHEGRFTSLHLKDRRKGTKPSDNGMADVESNVVLGKGDVDIAGAVAEAKRQGIRYFFIEDESSRVIEQVPQSLEYVKSLDKHDH
uniref:sugar phosphate isomerase/epimerase family protein n=1 Tax=Shewanella gaetbuli TaxID=220752 RepID=UPI003B594B5B